MSHTRKHPVKLSALYWGIFCLFIFTNKGIYAQDTAKSVLDFNNNKFVKKVNSLLDSNQKKITKLIFNKADSLKSRLNNTVQKGLPREIEKELPYERLLNKKYTLGRRAYQNTVSQFNYYFNADQELKELLLNARNNFVDDFTETLPFYDYDLATTAKHNIDSIIYRCNANIVLHDLRSNWIDDAYLLMAKAYLFHKNFDTAGSILQFINYSFDEKENGADLPIGSNLRNTKGRFSIASPDNNRIWENGNVRNESMVWQARNYFEIGELNQGLSLLQLLKSDAVFPTRLYPFLYEQIAYGYYQMDLPDSAANYLIKAIPNAEDENAKTRWYYLIAQLLDKANKNTEAYHWYKKASLQGMNIVLAIYAKINVINIEAKNANNKWEDLANNLLNLTKKEKYSPYSDIIYFEMAKLAIKNNGYIQASEWLITSIKKNTSNLKQKQKSFELLASISYNNNNYAIAKLAYDNLTGSLKTNPDYENIILRKKWLDQININDQLIRTQDSLQFFYTLSPPIQNLRIANWQKNQAVNSENIKDLFIEKVNKPTADFANNNFNSNNFNALNVNSKNFNDNNSIVSDFYFENKNSINQGKQNFIQKWGERPNVDNWRRKSSGNIAYNKTNLSTAVNTIAKQDNPNSKDSTNIKLSSLMLLDKINYESIKDDAGYSSSQQKWNKTAMANAQLFLLQLNDFEKALQLYKKIIEKNIDPFVTERALLDMASQYLHDNNQTISDSLIQIVNKRFPKGYYASKKQEAYKKKSSTQNAIDEYKEAYFLTQIGNWDSLLNLGQKLNTSLSQTKWNTPYQFLKVKMFAQQRKDSLATIILDSILINNQNELIREKAKQILAEIKKRKETEAYLKQLVIEAPVIVPPIVEKTDLAATVQNNTSQQLQPLNATQPVVIAAPVLPRIIFLNDSTEDHYFALVTTKIKEVFVKEAQTAFNYLNNDEFKKQNLNTTYVQFDDNFYIVWIGPFETQKLAANYIQKIKPRLKDELLSFIPVKQYEIYLLGKSNILQIKTKDDLDLYKDFMLKNIYN